MKNPLLTAIAIASLAAPIAVHAQQPPIIDRQLVLWRGTDRRRADFTGRAISLVPQAVQGYAQHLGKEGDEPFSAARPVSAEATRPVRNYFWSRDSKYILYAQDAGGRRKLQHLRHRSDRSRRTQDGRAADARAHESEGRAH